MSNITKHDMLTKEIELKLQAIEEKYLPSTRLKYGSTELTKLLLKLSEVRQFKDTLLKTVQLFVGIGI